MKNFISHDLFDFEEGAVIDISNEDDGGWSEIMRYEQSLGNPEADIILFVECVFDDDDSNINFHKRDRDPPLVVLRF